MSFCFKKSAKQFYKCNACGVLFQFPNKSTHKIYKEAYYSNSERKPNQFINYFTEQKNSRILKQIKKYKQTGTLLDIGAGYGLFVKNAKEDRFNAFGIEPNAHAVAYAYKKLKIHLSHGFFSKKSFTDGRFDVITAFHVIEHTSDPVQFIKDIRNKLLDNGLLVIETPNIASVNARLMKKRWPFIIPDEHLFLFSQKSLNYILKRNGFRSIYSQRIGPFIHIKRNDGITNEIRSQKPSWKMKNIKAAYDFMSKNLMLGDHILMIFEKV